MTNTLKNKSIAELINLYPNDADLGKAIRTIEIHNSEDLPPAIANHIDNDIKSIIFDEVDKVTRLEVINHAKNSMQVGRLLTVWKEMGDFEDIDFHLQDKGKTLKIFLS
jgi:hypothetical protein